VLAGAAEQPSKDDLGGSATQLLALKLLYELLKGKCFAGSQCCSAVPLCAGP
jgi:hypothetical protein